MARSRSHLADVWTKLADLQAMERVLADMVARCGEGTTPKCSILEALFDPAPASDGAAGTRRDASA